MSAIWKQLGKERKALTTMEGKERAFLKSRNKSLDSDIDKMHDEIEKTANSLLRTFYKLFEEISDAEELDLAFVEELNLEPVFEIGS